MKASPTLSPNRKDLIVFHNVAQALTSELELDAVLRTIMRQMERHFRPEEWSLLVMDEARQELVCAVAVGPGEKELRNLRVPVGQGLAGWVAARGEPLVIAEGQSHPRLVQPETGNRIRIRSAICIPLRSRRRILGVLQLFNAPKETFSEESLSFLHLLCDYSAIAIENANQVERIQQLSITDDCTGLFNQRQLYRVLERERENARLSGSLFSLCFIDLDYFKRVNDAHGHLMGSRVLAEFGETLRGMVRPVDTVFRYGGDEFVVLLHDAGKSEAERVVRRLHDALRTRLFQTTLGLNLNVRASYGVATWPEDGEEVEELLMAADAAMYRVKVSTRDDVAVAGENLQPR